MPKLLSGSTLRRGGSGEFLDLKGAMPQLPESPSTSTGFTLVTNRLLQTRYSSSLGHIEFNTATMYSALPEGTIRILSTGTSFLALNTYTGNLVVRGGIGVGANMHVEDDIVVNGLTIGRGFEGSNNIAIKGIADPQVDEYPTGQQSIVIGYDALQGITTSYKNIAIGRHALSSGTYLFNSVAIGDGALKNAGVLDNYEAGSITAVDYIVKSNITNISNTNPISITANSHGLTSGDQIYITGVNGVTTSTILIGTLSLVNEKPLFVNVTDPNNFTIYNDRSLTSAVDGTEATPYVSGGEILREFIITVSSPNLTTGTYVYISGVNGMVELNNKHYYVSQLSSSEFGLFKDPVLEEPIDPTGYSSYINGGTVFRPFERSNNIGLGNNAGEKLYNGNNNLLLGNNVAQNLTTGSNNIIIGNNKAEFLYNGSGIISIGGDNIVNGIDNQINIGSVFYFDGAGYATINAETTIGLGSESTSSDTGALTVVGGAGLLGNLYVAGMLQVEGTATSTVTNLSVVGKLTANGTGPVELSPADNIVSIQPTGTGTVIINPLSTGSIDNVNIGFNQVGDARFDTVEVISTTNAVSTTTGALQVLGGMGIFGDVYAKTGNETENYLLYTPRVFVTLAIPPAEPRVGDFWIDGSIPAYLQYIRDGTQTFWIQVGAV